MAANILPPFSLNQVERMIVVTENAFDNFNYWETRKGKRVLKQVFSIMIAMMLEKNYSKTYNMVNFCKIASKRLGYKYGHVRHALDELQRLNLIEMTKEKNPFIRDIILTKEGIEHIEQQVGKPFPFFSYGDLQRLVDF